MKLIKIIAVTAAAATGMAAATAAMAKSGHGPRMSFEEIDTDSNGEISKAEIQAMKNARFSQADANGDGKLTAEEMQAHHAKRASDRAARMIEKFDKDGDGALSMDELPKPRRHGDMFEKLDADGSGGITKEEFEEAKSRFGGRRHGRGHGHGDGGNVEQN